MPAAIIIGVVPFASSVNAETIGVFTKSAGNPIAKAARAGADQVGKSLGVTIFHYIPTSPDNVPQQTFLVEEALRQKRDAIVFTPVDVKAMVPVIQKVNAAGVPLINISDRLAGAESVAFIGTDDYAIALATARALFKAMDGKGNLIVLDGPPNSYRYRAPKGLPRCAQGSPKHQSRALEERELRAAGGDRSAARHAEGDAQPADRRCARGERRDGVRRGRGVQGSQEEAAADHRHQRQQGSGRHDQGRRPARERRRQRSHRGLPRRRDRDPHVRKEPVPKEVMAKTEVVTKANLAAYETPVEKRPCPTLASTGAK